MVTIPPSPPTAIFLLGKNEKHATSPIEPTILPSKVAPCACAASSIKAILLESQISRNLEENGCPKRCTPMTAFVRSEIFFSTSSGQIHQYSFSTSAKIGVAPVKLTLVAVAMKVKEGTITSSPGPISSNLIAAHRAAEPL